MVRKVSVKLDADTGTFEAGVGRSEEKTAGLNRELKQTDERLNKIPADAAKAAAALKLLGTESADAKLKLDDIGKSSTVLGLLDKRLADSRMEVRKLADEFNRTGDAHVLEKMFSAQKEVRGLERLSKNIAKALGDAGEEGGKELTKSLSATLQGVASTPGLGPAVIATLVAAALAASPVILATLNAALLGGLGAGGLALGIAGQFKDPAVKSAISDLGSHLSRELTAATQPFRGPLLTAIADLSAAAGRLLGKIDFERLATAIGPIERGLSGMLDRMGPGFSQALSTGAGLLGRVLGDELPRLGSALNDFFQHLAGGSKGAEEALRLFIQVVGGLLVILGRVIEVGGKVTERIVNLGANVTGFLDHMTRGIPIVGDFFSKLHQGWEDARGGGPGLPIKLIQEAVDAASGSAIDRLKETSDAWKEVNADLNMVAQTATKLPVVMDGVSAAMHGTAIGAVNDWDSVGLSLNQVTGQLEGQVFNAVMGVAQANIAWHQSLLNVDDAVKQNGHSLDDHSKAGLNNQLAVLSMVQANQQVYQANIASGMSAEQARGQYEANHDAMVNAAVAAGFNANEVHGLTDRYRAVPQIAETEIIARGIRSVLDAINDLIWHLALLDEKSATVDVYYRTHGMPNPSSGDSQLNFMLQGGIVPQKAAAGLLAPQSPGTLVLAGEPGTGGEAFIPFRGISAGRAMMLGKAALGGYGLDVVPRWHGARSGGGSSGGTGGTNVTITINAGLGANGAELGRQVADVLRPFIRSNGGGNVQVALGRRGA